MQKSGWIILDKPSGIFSRSAGGRVARIIGTKKFGHIGTLDEMASGVLALAFGSATKMIHYVEERDNADVKEYMFSMFFGTETTTLDIMGKEISAGGNIPDENTVINILPRFIGEIMQIPPAFSAVHIDGRRAYDLARAGKSVEIPPRKIRIYELELVEKNDNSWLFRVVCSRGTYVRSLARDIAYACGTTATVDMIRRLRSGPFDIKNAQKLDFLEKLGNNGDSIDKYLMPVDFGLADIPVLNLPHDAALRYVRGGAVQTDAAMPNGLVRVYDNDTFVGMGMIMNGVCRPKRIL